MAFLRTPAPPSCHATTTTTTTTTLTAMPLDRRNASSFAGSVAIVQIRSLLEGWVNGTAPKLASDVADVVYVAHRS